MMSYWTWFYVINFAAHHTVPRAHTQVLRVGAAGCIAKPMQRTLSRNALEHWQPLYSPLMAQVNAVLHEMTQSTAALIPNIADHIISSGGKRIRPVITLLSAQLSGYSTGDRHVRLAAAIEFLHTATLLHDDVVDESLLRRGKPTANAAFGNSASVLVGDYMLSCAFQLMARDGSLEVLRVLSDTSAIITEGEVHQLMAQQNISTTRAQYLHIITAKTAQLFAAAGRVGGILGKETGAQAPQSSDALLETYGRNLGIIFQIVDDVLDYTADATQLGKAVGDDFREGKVTLPVLFAYEVANADQQSFWQRVITEPHTQTADDLPHAITLIQQHNVLEKCQQMMLSYHQEAATALKNFTDCDAKQALLDILDFAAQRQN